MPARPSTLARFRARYQRDPRARSTRRTLDLVGGSHSDAVHAARVRLEELQKRAARVAEGQRVRPEDVETAAHHARIAHERLRVALLRSAEAHRSAAQVAVFAGDNDAVVRHERAARADELAAEEVARTGP